MYVSVYHFYFTGHYEIRTNYADYLVSKNDRYQYKDWKSRCQSFGYEGLVKFQNNAKVIDFRYFIKFWPLQNIDIYYDIISFLITDQSWIYDGEDVFYFISKCYIDVLMLLILL